MVLYSLSPKDERKKDKNDGLRSTIDAFSSVFKNAVHKMGIHTALDTNGGLGDRLSDTELENIDLILLDIKNWDTKRHFKLTGTDIGPVVNFARRLATCKNPPGFALS